MAFQTTPAPTQAMFFSHLPHDAEAVEVIEEIIATDGASGNIDHIWDVTDAQGNFLGKAYKVNEFMVEFVHEAVFFGSISHMQPEYVGNRPIGV